MDNSCLKGSTDSSIYNHDMVCGPCSWLAELAINPGYLLQCYYKYGGALDNLPAFISVNLTAWEALSIPGKSDYVADDLGIVFLILENVLQ